MRTKTTDVYIVSATRLIVGLQPNTPRARRWFAKHQVPPGPSALWAGGWLYAEKPAAEALVAELFEAGFTVWPATP